MRTRIEIKRIELWSLFKIAFFLYAIVGFVAGVFYGFFIMLGSLLGLAVDDEFAGFGIVGGLLGLILIPFMAILYGAIGSVFVTIGGWVFNLVSGFGGGLRIEAEFDMPQAAPTAAPVVPSPAPGTPADTPPAEVPPRAPDPPSGPPPSSRPTDPAPPWKPGGSPPEDTKPDSQT